MKTRLVFLVFLLLVVSFGIGLARQTQQGSNSCGFAVEGEPSQANVKGPDSIVPLVYVVEQPDSPIEIVSVDLDDMQLSVSNEEYTAQDCATYTIRNRSDRAVRNVSIALRATNHGGGAIGFEAKASTALKPGETIEVGSCGAAGRGGAPENYVRLLVYVHSVDFGNCLYQPSLRIPSSLKVAPVW
jgi:hypothetical protein